MQGIIAILAIAVFAATGIVLIFIFVQPSDINDVPTLIIEEQIVDLTNSTDNQEFEVVQTEIVTPELSGKWNVIAIAETLGLSDFQTNANFIQAIPESQPDLHRGGGGGGGNNNDNENLNPSYALSIFEGNDPTDGVIGMSQEIKAVATTDNPSITHVTFRWIAPNAVVAEETLAELHSPAEDIYSLGQPGGWTIEADFGNGVVLTENVNVPYLVLPESTIGNVILVVSALAALGGYYVLSRRNSLGASLSI
jgi:hypothetical protein